MSRDLKNIIIKLVFIILIFVAYFSLDYYNKYKEKINYREVPIKLENNDKLKVYFIDVGEADSILINDNNEFALIDGGNNRDGKKLVDYFNSLGITKFKYVFATHAHEDHIGGLDYIIRNFDIENFYMPDTKVDNITYYEVLDELKNKNKEVTIPTIDDTITINKAKLRVLYSGTDNEELNNSCIVLKLIYGDNSYLFMADATYEIEHQIINKNIKSDVLKVGHHGSNYSTSANFLYKVHPKYSVISVGKNNDYGFPKKGTINKLTRVGSEIYRTDIDGTIISISDGKEITFKKEVTNTNGE